MNNSSRLDPEPASPSTADGSPSITSPPYWVQSHRRSVSNISVESVQPGAITLQDNTDGTDDNNEACWAKGVHIDDYVVINSSRTGIGAFVVWNVTVETLSVSPTISRKFALLNKVLTLYARADLYAYESDTRSLTTSEISCCRHSHCPKLLCRHCLPKA
jgi:hypothetical protein